MSQPEHLNDPDGHDVLPLGAATPKGRRTRGRILASGRTVLEEKGYFAGSTSEVAARAGVALGTFYRYFNNKEQLFLEILAALVEEMRNAAGSAWGDDDDPLTSLRKASRRYLSSYRHNRRLIAAFDQMSAAVPECARLWLDLRAGIYEAMERHLRRTCPASAVDPALAASALGGMVEEFAHHWFVEAASQGRRIPSLDEAADTLAQIWNRAIYSRP